MIRSIDTPLDLESLPGHHVRRLQQIAVAVFLQETEAHGITPVQFAALQTAANSPHLDQRTLARSIGFDTSTIAGVIDRLEARGLMRRSPSPTDRRARLLTLTDEGHALLAAALPGVRRAQERILAPLAPHDRAEFLRMLRTLVTANNELSRAPSDVG
jgi:DNA-binding MarR family transcriptional regulator